MADQLKLTTEVEAAVKMNDLKEVMRLKDISHRSMVELMRTRFPRFDATLLSKVRNPDSYGVVLHPEGYAILMGYPDRKKDNRKLKHRITIRMTSEEEKLLRAYLVKDGYKSVQDWGRDKVQEYICIAENVLGRIE